jgi:MFS family permease
VLAPYRAVLGIPGALAFSASGLLARAEIAMVGLGCVLLVQAGTGSYALGGAVAGTYGVSHAVVSPLIARLVDRYGQAAVLRPAVLLHAIGLLALAAAGTAGAHPGLLLALAVVAGASEVGAGSLVRARWAALLRGSPRLQTALALESVLDETVFIVGPLLVTILATAVHPASGLVLAAVTAVAGALLLAGRRATQPPLRLERDQRGTGGRGSRSALGAPGMVVLVLVFLAAGGIFGSAEVAVVATTGQAGVPAAAGAVLALWAAGSLLSGLVYGAIGWRGGLVRRFAVCSVLLALLTAPMALAVPVPVLAVVFFAAGVAIAPTITTGNALVEAVVPPGRLTEGFAWTNTALSLTYSLGAAAAGAVADAAGGHVALLVPVGCAAATAVVALLGVPRLLAGTRATAPTG